jgi:DEAD/DEAH box helicase domain-containing protein
LGVTELWTHQAQAIDLVLSGRSVAVATGTGSGKSLCYQLPIAVRIVDDPCSSALLVFPTKALAQDQLRALADAALPGVQASTHDGDSSAEQRLWVRRNANVVLTNPEMLHLSILPQHPRWARLLRNLAVVVVDELHSFRGIFGSHMAHVLRRLRRLCRHYGSDPVFVFCSATIGRPGELAARLAATEVVEVTDDGSPRGERLVALWNPPLLDEVAGVRRSSVGETAGLVADLMGRGHRTVAFCRSRRSTETVAAAVRDRLGPELAGTVEPYRAGYLPSERREVERRLFSGELRGVVATSALELGVDIGGLDVCVMNGFPGTISSFRQQLGRVGRSGRPSVGVLVGGTDQLDQWLMEHPTELMDRPPEPAVVNPSNPFVLRPHLACAAFELPLSSADESLWGDDLEEAVADLARADLVRVTAGRASWVGGSTPAFEVSLRTGGSGEVAIETQGGDLVGTVDDARACATVHPGAVYVHQGQAYRVVELDLQGLVARVVPDDGRERTNARSATSIRVLRVVEQRPLGISTVSLGLVEVTDHVVGYQRTDQSSGELLGDELLDLPPSRLVTTAFWWTVDERVVTASGVAPTRLAGALHAAEHASIGVLPLFTICDRWDVGGVSTACHGDTAQPTVFVYDGYPGGAGVADLGYDEADRLLSTTRRLIEDCGCADGCPSCVVSPKCGNGNDPLDKAGAIALLAAVLD